MSARVPIITHRGITGLAVSPMCVTRRCLRGWHVPEVLDAHMTI
jgi:hypothetical protein